MRFGVSVVSKRPRIVFVNRFFYPDQSATSQLLGDLAFFLCKQGYEVVVVASRGKHVKNAEALPKYEVINGVVVHRLWTSRVGKVGVYSRAVDYLTFYLSSLYVLARVISKDSCVIAKTDPPLISMVIYPIVKIKGAKLINWVQDLFPEVAEVLGIGFGANAVRRIRNIALKSAFCNVVIGDKMRARVVAQGVAPASVKVIHNWVEDAVSDVPIRQVQKLREEWGLKNRFVVGYSGNFGRVHEFNSIIGAVEILRDSDSISFVFVGHGVQYDNVKKHILDRKIGNVKFLPYQPRCRLNITLAVPDVHLVTLLARMEGLVVPSKIYGIAAVGRPTIFVGDAEGEIGEMITSQSCGYCVAPGDAAALVEKILLLSKDTDLVQRLGGSAKRMSESKFRCEFAFRKWSDILETV